MGEIAKQIAKQIEEELSKEFMRGKSSNTNITVGCGGDVSTWTRAWSSIPTDDDTYSFGFIAGNTETRLDFIPTKVIYNCPATICFFPDGSKVMVKCAKDEEYVKEYGVMACINKKIFESRNSFKRLVNSGYENQDAIFERIAHNGQLKRQK